MHLIPLPLIGLIVILLTIAVVVGYWLGSSKSLQDRVEEFLKEEE